MDSKILVANNIYKSFSGVQALKNVSFDIAPGEIHCLVGENGSGKSTFVKIVAGVLIPDQGEIVLNGNKYTRLDVRDSIREGVQIIYQDLSLFFYMNVAENIAYNKMIVQKKRLVDWKEVYRIAQKQLDKVGVPMNLEAPVGTLSIAKRQVIAICRALSMDAKIIFMDEPTSALTKYEVERLLSIVLELKKKGTSIVFISHKLDEVMKVADKIAIFRDGEKVSDFKSADVNEEMLIYHMTGRKVDYPRYIRKVNDNENILKVNNLTSKGNYNNINFNIRKGDIVGIIGLLGAGRTEIALTMFGLNPQDSGKIIMEGKEYRFISPNQAINCGISMLPENRQTQGCFFSTSISDNISSAILDRIKNKLGILDTKLKDSIAQDTVKKFRVRTNSIDTEVKNLSGGNQQKVVLGKWIATLPKLLILDSPTVGVDVGTKAEIYEYIQHLANQGMGIILISDEIQEVLVNCNKLIVIRAGEIVAKFNNNDLEAADNRRKIYELINANNEHYISTKRS